MRIIINLITYFFISCFLLICNYLNKGFNHAYLNETIYICFDHDDSLIEIDQLAGSSIATFKISRKGYETMEQRKLAYRDRTEEEKLMPVNALFFFEFYATMYPAEVDIQYLEEVNCRSLEELREGKVDVENQSQLVFIQRHPHENGLVWKDVKRRIRI